jgi:hypothetical protein
MRKKAVAFTAMLSVLLAPAQSRGGEGKFSSAFGLGAKQGYNNMLAPYEFSGGSYGLLLEWQTVNPDAWLSDVKLNLRYDPLFASSSATSVKIYNATQHRLGADAQRTTLWWRRWACSTARAATLGSKGQST